MRRSKSKSKSIVVDKSTRIRLCWLTISEPCPDLPILRLVWCSICKYIYSYLPKSVGLISWAHVVYLVLRRHRVTLSISLQSKLQNYFSIARHVPLTSHALLFRGFMDYPGNPMKIQNRLQYVHDADGWISKTTYYTLNYNLPFALISVSFERFLELRVVCL